MQTGRGRKCICEGSQQRYNSRSIGVFCIHTYHDMMRLYALGIDDKPEINFRAAAVNKYWTPTALGRLQDIVSAL